VRPGYNRVLAEEFEALKVKRAGLVKDKVEAYSQGDLRENFGFKAAKEAIRAIDRKMSALDRFVARNTFTEIDPPPGSPNRQPPSTRARDHHRKAGCGDETNTPFHFSRNDAR